MKRSWRYTLIGIFLCLLLLGGLTLQSIRDIQQHSKLINYAGIVRGATQRLVKNEISDHPDDAGIRELDTIINGLLGKDDSLALLVLKDDVYQKRLHEQKAQWELLKETIRQYRHRDISKEYLVTTSEQYFTLSNATVFAAEEYSEKHTHILMFFIILMSLFAFIFWLFIYISDIRKIGRLEITNKQLETSAGMDNVTDAYNIDYFDTTACKLIQANTTLKYAIFYVDFADFKYINDVFGHAIGDRVLKQYARILLDDLRENEIVGRVNADNFVILRYYDQRDELLKRQEALDHQMHDFMRESLNNQVFAINCGICCIEDVKDDLTIEELLNRSNFARKLVKNGKTPKHYQFYDESIREHLFQEKAMESAIDTALQQHEFKVYYQPKVAVASETIIGAEALVRWEKADGTLLMPDTFIPIFEKNRMIPLLDQYVFEEVCRWLRQMLDQGKKVVPISVNVSKLQFYDMEFVHTYDDIKHRYQIPDKMLDIEFTESVIYDNWEHLGSIVNHLKSHGFLCSIDDFGKGSSSLSMIKNLDIDVLKIDALFFKEFTNKEKDQKLVEGIIRLAHQLHIETIAEGIETREQVDKLRELCCDLIQGYVFYRPMPQNEFEDVLKS